MNKLPLPLGLALMIICLVGGLAAGYYLTPEYRLSMYEKNTMDLGAADRWVDQRYLNAMITHHRGAMLLAEQAQRESRRPEIQQLAAKILADEPTAIAGLYTWRKDWYGDTRPVKDPAAVHLGSADKTFDLRFLNALIAHHEAGLRMTAEIRGKSSRAAVLDNADAVDAFLTSTLPTLKGWRSDWYKL